MVYGQNAPSCDPLTLPTVSHTGLLHKFEVCASVKVLDTIISTWGVSEKWITKYLTPYAGSSSQDYLKIHGHD